MNRAERRRLRRIDVELQQLPPLECKGLCADSCGPIPLSRLEQMRIEERVGHPVDFMQPTHCPLLKDGRCSVYDIRPAICHLWGMVEGMPCPWGCKPSRMLTNEQGYAVVRLAMREGA